HYKKIFSLSGPEILMIGDRSSDRDAAIQSGSPFAFCSYGHAPDGEIENFSIELQSPESLFTALE
ncbi:MAG: HAD family hydrolase, partial [Leptospira sp.]|nr:HAD family hydrolase [Leptospira sp.]